MYNFIYTHHILKATKIALYKFKHICCHFLKSMLQPVVVLEKIFNYVIIYKKISLIIKTFEKRDLYKWVYLENF